MKMLMKLMILWAVAWAVLAYAIAHANIINNSANKPTFPPTGLTLLSTVVAQTGGARNVITVQNQSAEDIQVWRDTACTGVQLSPIVLKAAAGAGQQGGAWSSDTFVGCIRVYGLTPSDQVGIWQD